MRFSPSRWAAAWLLAGGLFVGCVSFHAGTLPGEPGDANYAAVEDTRLRYIDTGGDGPAVVLLHGYASSLEAWGAVVPALESSHRVIALDLKGFGWSGRPEGDYSPTAQAALVFGLLDQLGVQRAAVVAHSWGSSVALQMALSAPERVARVALYDAYVYEEQIPMFFQWSKLAGLGELLFGLFYNERPDERLMLAFYEPRLVTEELAEAVERAMQRPGTRAAALAVVRGMDFEQQQDRYAHVEQPVLLLWGREDAVTPLAFGERLLKQLPRAELEVFPLCGHFPMIEAASASTRALAKFLAGEGA